MQRSKLAVTSGFLGALGVFDVVLGPVLIQLGAIAPMFGFQAFFGLGLLMGLVALVLAPFALRATRAGKGRSGRGLAWLGLACGAALAAVLFVSAGPSADLPPINDITTDLEDPPAFVGDPAERGRDMAYPSEFVAQVRAAYPDLTTLHLSEPPAEVLARAEQAARDLGWEVVEVDASAGTLLARETTRLFRFVDDVLVRVRPGDDGGSQLDVRSKSRDGRGDLGANATRIRAFTTALQES